MAGVRVPACVDAFALRVALSFVLGGLAVALFTMAAERMGSRVGGLLLSFPVKVTIAMVLIGLNEGALFAAEAARAIPVGIGVNVVFLVATALLVRRLDPWPAILAAGAVWLVAGLVAVLAPPSAWWLILAAWLVPALVGLYLLAHARGERHVKPRDKFGIAGLLTRAVGAGTIVALSIVLARVAGPVVGGLASVFPSGWITTMVILTRHHGPEFTGATTRVMVAGSAAPVMFGVAIALLYPVLGVILGTVVAIGLSVVISLTIMAVLRATG